MLRVSARCISSAGHARKVLGLSPSAATSVRELKAAFRRRALETHPDHGGSSERFREVSLAYSTLVRNLGGQPQDPSTSTSSGQSGMPEGWSPTEEEFEEEFTKWQKKMREEEAEQERRHQHEAAHAVPKFFTWRLGLRILVAYLMFRVAVVLIWVHLHGDGPGTKETATRKRHDSTSDCMASSQRLCLRNADGNVANYSRK